MARLKATLTSMVGRLNFNVSAWGPVADAEVLNAASTATSVQRFFNFEPQPDVLPLDESKYRFANGAIDLDRAAEDFSRRRSNKHLLGDNLILVTGAPYGSGGQLPRT